MGENGTRLKGSDSVFYLYADDVSGNHRLVIEVVYDDKHENYLLVNGNRCGDLVFKDGIAEVEIPSKYLVSGLNELRIQTEEELYTGLDPETGIIHTDQNLLVKSIGVY